MRASAQVCVDVCSEPNRSPFWLMFSVCDLSGGIVSLFCHFFRVLVSVLLHAWVMCVRVCVCECCLQPGECLQWERAVLGGLRRTFIMHIGGFCLDTLVPCSLCRSLCACRVRLGHHSQVALESEWCNQFTTLQDATAASSGNRGAGGERVKI